MLCENESEKIIQIKETELNFDSVYNKEYIPQLYRDAIEKANVLLIPYEGFRDNNGYFFPESTSEFYSFLKNQEAVEAEICIDDDGYKKLELHSEILYIATLIVQFVVLPTITSLMASFLYDKVRSMNRKNKDVNLNIHIIVDKDGKAKEVTYSGNVEDFEETMKTLEETIFK